MALLVGSSAGEKSDKGIEKEMDWLSLLSRFRLISAGDHLSRQKRQTQDSLIAFDVSVLIRILATGQSCQLARRVCGMKSSFNHGSFSSTVVNPTAGFFLHFGAIADSGRINHGSHDRGIHDFNVQWIQK